MGLRYSLAYSVWLFDLLHVRVLCARENPLGAVADRVKYSAKILARFIIADPSIRTYTDIGRKAFGKKSTHLISLAFSLETFTVTVALVTLYADSLGEPSTCLPRLAYS